MILLRIFCLILGRFLYSMLEIVMKWHADKKTYEKVSERFTELS